MLQWHEQLTRCVCGSSCEGQAGGGGGGGGGEGSSQASAPVRI